MATIGKDIRQAQKALLEGGLVAIPTETVYGLAANALDPVAVTKIFVAKERPAFDPLIVHVASLEHARGLVKAIPEKAKKLRCYQKRKEARDVSRTNALAKI